MVSYKINLTINHGIHVNFIKVYFVTFKTSEKFRIDRHIYMGSMFLPCIFSFRLIFQNGRQNTCRKSLDYFWTKSKSFFSIFNQIDFN